MTIKNPIEFLMPVAFIPTPRENLWVMQDTIAVFNMHQAEVVFAHVYYLETLQIWGIRDGKAALLGSLSDAHDFFGA
jgi:hypothetical protein